jgi:hypothetical protein
MNSELTERAHEFLAGVVVQERAGDRMYALAGNLKRYILSRRNSLRLRRVQQKQRQIAATPRRRRSARRRTDKYYAHLQKLAHS